MRKIEQDMLKAINECKNFKNDNTRVRWTNADGTSQAIVYLHDNMIASYKPSEGSLYIRDGGWASNTTKSRLNVLLGEFAPRYDIVQRDWGWYIVSITGIAYQRLNAGGDFCIVSTTGIAYPRLNAGDFCAAFENGKLVS